MACGDKNGSGARCAAPVLHPPRDFRHQSGGRGGRIAFQTANASASTTSTITAGYSGDGPHSQHFM